jgi:hypothetical protein
VAEVRNRHPGKGVIPVWVTECEPIDLPGAAGGTGLCGTVPCAKGSCWPRYQRAWDPLVKAASGPLAIALWSETFQRDRSWLARGLGLFVRPTQGQPIAPERAIAILPAWGGAGGKAAADAIAAASALKDAGAGWVIARTAIDQSWEPRSIPAKGK